MGRLFYGVALLSAQRSKDPNTQVCPCINRRCVTRYFTILQQVGACIVNRERKIVGIGYNGMPTGCSDDALPWAREADTALDTKYPYGECPRDLNESRDT